MRFARLTAFSGVLCLASGLSAYGADLSLTLEVRSGQQKQSARSQATSDQAPSRPVFAAKSKDSIQVEWSVTGTSETVPSPDVTVHCFLARENAIGQQAPPDLGDAAEYESALTVDFEPGAKTSATFVVRTPGPGIYLLRIEAIDPNKDSKHPDFAAIDLKVE